MAQAKSKYSPESGVLGGQDFEDQTVARFNANRTMQSGTARPEDIQPDEVWQKILADGTREFYLWREGDTGDGTLLLMMSATDEQLESLSQAQLEKLAINAFQFKQIKDPVDYATEHGQIGDIATVVSGDLYDLTQESTTFITNPSLGSAILNAPEGWGEQKLVCIASIDEEENGVVTLINRIQKQLAFANRSNSSSLLVWKCVSDGSQGMPSARKIANISVPIHLYSSSGEYASSYIAPANGKLRSTLRYSGTLQEVRLLNVDTFETSGSTMGASAGGVGSFFASIDVKKGDRVVIACASTTTGFTIFSDFIYAEGN